MSTDQMDAFAARDAALERVQTGHAAWIERHAAPVIRRLARERPFFTTDDVWELVEQKPEEPRALGAAMMAARRAGLIVKTQQYTNSRRQDCHARPIPIWASVR